MKRLYGILIHLMIAISCFSHEINLGTHPHLKEYESEYEYLNDFKLRIVMSPEDTETYAIVNKSRYHLTAVAKDLCISVKGL